jgi:hypothetical protein
MEGRARFQMAAVLAVLKAISTEFGGLGERQREVFKRFLLFSYIQNIKLEGQYRHWTSEYMWFGIS